MFGQVQVTFKVFTHWNEDSKPEVRRFGVEKCNVTSFQKLNEKLHQVFPGLKTKTYSVTWKDEEGDDITISSDEEVESALSAFSGNGNIVKLNIYVNEGKENEDECDVVITAVHDNPTVGPPNLCHRGVTCDGCDSTVVGFRYKCTSCIDYDLCPKCEASGTHPEHCMVRIPSPVMPHAMIKTAFKKSRHFLKSFADDKTDKRHLRRDRNSGLEMLAIVLNELANLARDIDQNVGRQEKQSDSNMETQSNKKGSLAAGKEASVVGGIMINKGKETGFKFGIVPTEQEKTVRFRLPLGQIPPVQQSENAVFPPFGWNNVPKADLPQRSIFGVPSQRPQFGLFRPTDSQYGNGSGGWNQHKPNIGFGQLCVEGPKEHKFHPSTQLFGSSAVFGGPQHSSGGFFSATAQSAQTAKPEPMPADEPEPTPHHPKPHVDNAIKQMLSMGFTNDGGWLTQLVEKEDGNIAAVLEYLPTVAQPTQQM